MVDAASGEFAGLREMPWYCKALALSQPLHFGSYGGLPLKLLSAALIALGRLSAWFDDGLLDAFAWCALTLPVAVVPWAMLKARRAPPGKDA